MFISHFDSLGLEKTGSHDGPDSVVDKYASCMKKIDTIVRHLPKGPNDRFAKTNFFFLRADEFSSCTVLIKRQPIKLWRWSRDQSSLWITSCISYIYYICFKSRVNIGVIDYRSLKSCVSLRKSCYWRMIVRKRNFCVIMFEITGFLLTGKKFCSR